MKTLKDKILSQYEPDLAVKLLEFAETLSKQDCDVFVFMSRKFCCLYDVLLSIGMPPVQKPIVSDKILDLETKFFKGKVIRIVDDIIICGTTLWKARDRLLNYYEAKEVKTSVFCVNDEFWVKECIEPDYKVAVLSDERALTFCSSIVRSLSIAPRPYATEFPYFSGIEVKTQYWHQILSSKDWSVYDITDKFQEDNGISTLTFFPSITVLDEIKKNLDESIGELIDIAKVRIYAEKIDWGMKMSILPIITFKPLLKTDIKSIFENLIKMIRNFDFDDALISRLKSEFSNPVSQLRFIQYIFSLALASEFKLNLQKNLSKKVNLELRDLDVELLFGKWNLPAIKAFAKIFVEKAAKISLNITGIKPASLDLENTELNDLMGDSDDELILESFENGSEEDARNIFSDFSNIFLSLYQKKEIPSRAEVKEAAIQGNWDKIRKIDRLETGITWIGILEYLKKIFDYSLTPEVKNVLSLVLDYSVDKGICVPVIRYNPETDIIFRAYRHGEDVKFSEQETELCGLAIENAQKAIEKDKIPRLFLEKLLVLFIKIGASKSVFQVQYGTSGQDGIAKIGFHLQGAVAKLKKKNSYRQDSEIWLSRHLLEKGVIKIVDKGRYAFRKHYSAIQISSSSKSEAQKFGYILGLLYKGYGGSNKVRVRLTDEDLVFLSTCFRPKDIAAALFVELDFYIEDLIPLIEQIADDFEKIWFNKSEVHQSIWDNRGFEALNSLHKKTIGWFENGAKKAIDKGKEILENLNLYTTAIDWESYWLSLEIKNRVDEERKFNEFIFQMASVGHRLLLNINLLEILLSFSRENPSYDNNDKLRQSIDKLNYFYETTVAIRRDIFIEKEHRLIDNLKKQVETDFVDFDEQKTFKYLIKQFYELDVKLSHIIPLADIALDDFEQRSDGTKFYNYLIWYDIVDSTATEKVKTEMEVDSYRKSVKKVKTAVNDFIRTMEKEALAKGDEIFCWNGNASSYNDEKHIFFSSSKLGFSIKRVREFLDRLFSNANSKIAFRVIAIPTNAFYSEVFRRFEKSEVEGERFWEHFSRVRKKLKEIEGTFALHKNLVLVIGNESIPVASKRLNLKQKLWEDTIETLIAGAYYKTKGELWTPKFRVTTKKR